MRLSTDCLRHVISYLDTSGLLAAAQTSVEFYNVSLLIPNWRRAFFHAFPELGGGNNTVSFEGTSVDKTSWRIAERRYNNNPRSLVLDRNQKNRSIRTVWKGKFFRFFNNKIKKKLCLCMCVCVCVCV